MPGRLGFLSFPNVALRKESVDRKFVDDYQFQRVWVALRKESVDRKADEQLFRIYQISVALRKESVDRKILLGGDLAA